MKTLFKNIFQRVIELGNSDYSDKENKLGWIGNPSTSNEKIIEVEKRLNVSLPDDYKELLLIANGFKAPNSVEPSFLPVEEIDYLKNTIPFIIEAYEDTLKELEDSILIGGADEEQKFLLIPPKVKNGKWTYWKFANWLAGVQEFEDLRDYMNSIVTFFDDVVRK